MAHATIPQGRKMNIDVEIDERSGFCFGVTRAIELAQEKLASGDRFYCLGDIVHNGMECNRLAKLGMLTIGHGELLALHDARVLLRAHGEPPETYRVAHRNGIEIVDATCPVVLRLQQRIAREYAEGSGAQIVIYGKRGHAEVLGLVGQTEGNAIVIENIGDAAKLDFSRSIRLYSQTTRALGDFRAIVDYIGERVLPPATFEWHDTICRQVSNRLYEITKFALRHDVILFVCGRKSSNGHVLYEACRRVNPRSHCIELPGEIDYGWLEGAESVGICGATSTPKWLMKECEKAIREH